MTEAKQTTDKPSAAVAVPAQTPGMEFFQRRSYESLINQPEGTIDATTGRVLVDKESLIDAPHIITGAVFREGASELGYVSVEATTANDVDVVYNDSGTGIRAQISGYLAWKGYVKGWTPEHPDVPWDEWEIMDPSRVCVDLSKKGKKTLHVRGILLHVRNGLRVSEYTFESVGPNGKKIEGDAKTYYLN